MSFNLADFVDAVTGEDAVTALGAKPSAPKPPRHRPFEVPVIEAHIGQRYVNDRKRGTIRDIRPAGRRDRTQVLFDIVYDDKSKSTVRHEMCGTFETVES